MKKTLIKDMGNTVLCDYCNEDYTNSKECGGLVFTSKAICPKCAPDALKRIRGYSEEQFIKAICPDDMPFGEFIVRFRGNDNKIEMIELDDGENFSDLFKGGDNNE